MTSNDLFAISTPAPIGDGFRQADLENHLIIVVAPVLKPQLPTQHGTADAADALLVVDLNTGNEYPQARFWGSVLVPQMTGGGDIVLGRLGKGQAGAAGRSAPWRLYDPTPDDQTAAKAWIDAAQTAGKLKRNTAGALEIATQPAPIAATMPAPAAPQSVPPIAQTVPTLSPDPWG